MKDEFNPDWPHGHTYIDDHGMRWPARIVAQLSGATRPVLAIITKDRAEMSATFCEAGFETTARSWQRLINAPAPGVTVVAEDIQRVVCGRHALGGGAIAVDVRLQKLSDGNIRASADVVP